MLSTQIHQIISCVTITQLPSYIHLYCHSNPEAGPRLRSLGLILGGGLQAVTFYCHRRHGYDRVIMYNIEMVAIS